MALYKNGEIDALEYRRLEVLAWSEAGFITYDQFLELTLAARGKRVKGVKTA